MTFSLSSSLTYIPFNVSAFIPAPSPKFIRDPSTMSKHRTGFGRVGTVNSAKIEEINIDDFDSIDVSSYCQEDKEGGPPIYNDSTWMLGDFEVITADNVRFRVPSYYLFASSSVFCDAGGLGSVTTRKISFTDTGYETAPVFRLYLQLVTQGLVTMKKNLKHMKELANFLLKWDCEAALNTLSAHLDIAIRRKEVVGHEAFIVAATAGDVNLCHLVLSVMWQEKWSDADAYGKSADPKVLSPLRGKNGQNIWDPRYWPAYYWTCGIPHRYLFALSRAYGDNYLTEKGLADGFRYYIDLMAKESS